MNENNASQNIIPQEEDILSDDSELSLDDIEGLLEAELEVQFNDLEFLEEERKNIGNSETLGKIILNEVWTQFGNQIGLDMTNETLIQEYDRKHPEEYKEIADSVMKDPQYKEANKRMRERQQNGELIDEYTGKKLGPHDNANLDHIVSRKEIAENKRRKQAGISTAALANKSENLAATNENLNKSKKDKNVEQYVKERPQREKDLKKQNEAQHKKIEESNKSAAEKSAEHKKIEKQYQNKLDAKDDLMLKQDAKARKAINHDIVIGATKETTKKAGKDALKAMAVSALFDLLKSIMNGLVRFFKEKQKSFKQFLNEMRESVKQFISHVSSFVRTGTSSAIGTVISEIFGPVVSMFKKLASFIKQGVKTFVDAIKYLKNKENKDKPLAIKIAKVGEIVTGSLTAAGAIILSEVFEKALLNIPIMAVQFPILGSLANITGMFLASLLSGVIGAIVINRINRYIENRQRSDNLRSQIEKKNEILQTQDKLLQVKFQKNEEIKEDAAMSITNRHRQAEQAISEALETIYRDSEDDNDAQFSFIDSSLDLILKNG